MMRWAHGEGMDLTLIETMPLGDIDGDRTDQYLPLSLVRAQLCEQFTLEDIPYKTGGPARYVTVAGDGRAARLHHAAHPQFLRKLQPGAPHLHRHALHVPRPGGCRRSPDAAPGFGEATHLLDAAIDEAIARKPKGHDFIIDRRHNKPALSRHMSVTGG